MKKLLTLLLILTSMIGSAQTWNRIYSYNEYLGLRTDSQFIPPQDTLRSAPIGSFGIKNNHVYQKLSTSVWSQVDGGGSGVVSLTGSQSIQYGTFAAMPAAGTAGRYYAATDVNEWFFDNGTSWLNLSSGGNVSNVLSPGNIIVGNGSGIAQQFTITGDFGFSSSGVGTINNNVVTNSKAAQMPALTIKGNNTVSTANSADLTTSQVASMLPVFAPTTNGLVPFPGSIAGKILSDNGTWVTPSSAVLPANPTSSIGLASINGTASTFMRSDAAPPLSQAIAPTWSAQHTFSIAPIFSSLTGYLYGNGAGAITAATTIPNSGLATMAANTIKGNNTGVTANAADLTAAQVAAILPTFTTTANGLVPSPGTVGGKVLSDNGTWIANGTGGGLPTASGPGHILLSNAANTFTDTILVSDLTTMPQYKVYQPGQGIKANDTVSGYPATAIDSLNYFYSTIGGASFPEQNGGWLSNHATGDSVQLYTPSGVCIGNSIIAGHPWRASGLESANLSLPDSFGQISWRLSQLTHFQWRNMGWGGQTTAQIRNRFLRDGIGLSAPNQYGSFSKTLSHKPSFVVIEGGVNDAQQHIPIDSIEANLLWMASMCAQYQIPCIFLNSVGDGGATSGNNITEARYISILNKWFASGILNQYGAIVVDINTLWNDPTYGNDNIHFSTYVNGSDKIHFTQAGYDSVAKLIFRVAKLPVLTKMVFVTAQSPSTPLTNYARPTSVSITGYPNGSTPTPNSTISLPNNAFDTVNITSVIPDTAYFTVLASTTVAGTGTRSGFGPMQFYLDNNPTNQIWYTQKTSFAGARSADLQSNSLTIYAPSTSTYAPLMVRRNDNNIGLIANIGNTTNMVLNNNAVIKSAAGGSTATLTVGGGIATGNTDVSQFGPSSMGSVSFAFPANAIPPAGNAIGAIGPSPHYGVVDQTVGGYNHTDGRIFDNANGLNSATTPSQPGGGGHSYAFSIHYNQGDFMGTNDTVAHQIINPVINQTTYHYGIMEVLHWLQPVNNSLGSLQLIGYRNSSGNNIFNDTAEKSGRTMIGTTTGDPSAQLDVTATRRGFMAPRMTTVQRDSIGYIDSIYMTGGAMTVAPTSMTISGGKGSGARYSISQSLVSGNAFFYPVEYGWGYGTTTPPTVTVSGGTGTVGTITARLHGPGRGNMIYNLDSNALQVYNGSGWTTLGSSGGTIALSSVVSGTGAGSGGSFNLSNNGYFNIGTLSITTGNSPSSSADLATYTAVAGSVYPTSGPLSFLTPGNAAAAGVMNTILTSQNGANSWKIKVGGTALAANTLYVFQYYTNGF